MTSVTFKNQIKSNMSSATSEFPSLTKEVNNNPLYQRNALSTIKRTRQCQRRKILNIAPLRLDEIQKEIEQASADTNRTWDLPKTIQEDQEDSTNKNSTWDLINTNPNEQNKENKAHTQSSVLQDSFDLNFAALSLNTPAKQQEAPKNEKFVTPCPKPTEPQRTNRSLDFHQYVTPNNKIPAKVQCSVNMKPYMRTPITKLYAVPNQKKDECDSQVVQSTIPRDIDFKRIRVNNAMYIILNELGRGGSSEVFHCYNLEAKTHRAIKVVSLENKVSAAGFINEVQVLKTLQKCNRIIRMFDFEIKREEKCLLVVLEVGGTDLSKILKESAANTSHMPLYMLLYYWMEMLYAVKQIHSHGIIHSDLKPANFLKVEGYLKLIDFGIASCIQSDMTSVFKAVPEGSFNYISPEALSNENSSNVNSPSYGKPKYKISYKSDVWSLGCILYQLVYRRTPFQQITQIWVKLATIVDPNHKIDYPNVDWVPQKIITTIKRCLQVNIKLRPSVDDLIAEYENVFQGLT